MANSSCALFSLTFDLIRPAVKIGCVNCDPTAQTPLNKLETELADPPRKASSVLREKYPPLAASARKLAATTLCPAERISGRRCRRDEASPGGTVGLMPERS